MLRRSLRILVTIALAAVVTITSPVAIRSAWSRGPLGQPGPTKAECTAARCAITQAVADACPCDAAVPHRSHVKCVSRAVKELLVAQGLPKECKPSIVRCAARSTCGRPGAVACRIPTSGETGRCRIRKSAERCTLRAGTPDIGTCCSSCPTTTSTSTSTTSTSTSTPTLESSTTTTSTSSTTVTTLLPCGGLFPACLGSCPPGETCTAGGILQPCVCTPTGP